jgi:hypothetical protein
MSFTNSTRAALGESRAQQALEMLYQLFGQFWTNLNHSHLLKAAELLFRLLKAVTSCVGTVLTRILVRQMGHPQDLISSSDALNFEVEGSGLR